MTNCSQTLDRLPLYVGGELDALDAAQVEGHLLHCESCSHEEQKLQESRGLFQNAIQAPSAELQGLNLWSDVRASMLAEGLLGNDSGQSDESTWELRPVASAAPKLSLVRRMASFASAAALIGVASLAGSGLLGSGTESVVDDGGFGLSGHVSAVAASMRLHQGESAMRRVLPGESSLSQGARPLRPLYEPRSMYLPAPVDPGMPGGSSLAAFQNAAPILELR